MKFVSKAVEINAVQFNIKNINEAVLFLTGIGEFTVSYKNKMAVFNFRYNGNIYNANDGDYIIKHNDGSVVIVDAVRFNNEYMPKEE